MAIARVSFRCVFLLLIGLGLCRPVHADIASVSLDVPPDAAVGTDVTVTVKVVHDGNNFFHFVDWVYLTANGREIARWTFEADSRPESDNFTRTATVTIQEPTLFAAEANCNIHGSAGLAEAAVNVAGAEAAPEGTSPEAAAASGRGDRTFSSAIHVFLLVTGAINFLLVLFQLATGRRWIRVRMTVHRRTGQVLVATALVHGLVAVIVNL